MRRRPLLLVLVSLAGVAAVVLLIGQAAHFTTLVHRLRAAAPGWLAVCAAGELIAFSGYAIGYRATAQIAGGPRLPVPIVLRVMGLAFGAFTVGTSLGGMTVDYWALREAGEPPRRAAARVIALGTLQWAVIGLATCAAAVAVLLGVGHRFAWEIPAAWLVVVTVCFAGGAWFSATERRERFTGGKPGLLRRAFGAAIAALVLLRALRREPRALRASALGGAAMFWAGDVLCAWAALSAFGERLGLAALVLGYATGYATELLPLPAGGSGSVDAALTGGFVLAGASLSGALLAAIAFRLFAFWLPALGALVSVLTVRGLRERLQELAAQREPDGARSAAPS